MSTYYAAQFGIALSVVDSRGSYIREKEQQREKQLGSIGVGSMGSDLRQRRPVISPSS